MTKKVLSEEVKHNITRLVDRKFIRHILCERLPKYYPDYKKLESFKLDPYKRHVSPRNVVFVVEFKIKYQGKDGHSHNLDIFCSAHSDGSRKDAYKNCKLLYENGFDKGNFRVTKPLFYLAKQKAFFYEGSPGRSFLNFFTQQPDTSLKHTFKLIVNWIKKIHQFDTNINFNWSTFRISKMVPPPKRFIPDFYEDNIEYGKKVENYLTRMRELKDKFSKNFEPAVIYGDYHPENVIIKDLKTKEIEMIDFTDLALGDPMVDLGTFLQQFDFMGHNYLDRKKINQYKEYLLEQYFGKDFDKIDIDYINRINLYQSWTALRSAILIFYQQNEDNPIDGVLEECDQYLQLAANSIHKINLH